MRWVGTGRVTAHDVLKVSIVFVSASNIGLGKTAQICTHFGSLALSQSKKGTSNNRRNKDLHSKSDKAIFAIVCPATILHHWLQEMHRWCPFVRTVVLHAASSTAAELLRVGNDGETLC
jgi:SNF2 family DNA or RNA helicase